MMKDLFNYPNKSRKYVLKTGSHFVANGNINFSISPLTKDIKEAMVFKTKGAASKYSKMIYFDLEIWPLDYFTKQNNETTTTTPTSRNNRKHCR